MQEKASIDEIRKILNFISKGYKVPKIIYDSIFRVAVKEIEEKELPVLIKRDPDIEQFRIQGATCKIIDGETIEIHPTVVGGYGADFDGDTVQTTGIIGLTDNFNNKYYHKFRQEDFLNIVRCKKIESKIKDDGVEVDIYDVLEPAFVLAIDNDTGTITEKKVTKWHIHKKLNMFSIERKPRITQTFNLRELWVSDNHSLVTYNLKTKRLEKTKPEDIIKDKSNYFLIRNVDNVSKIKQYNFNDCIKKFVVNKSTFMDNKQVIYKDKWNYIKENEFGYFLGSLVGDGYITTTSKNKNKLKQINNIIALTNSCDYISDKWCNILETLTENTVTRKEDRKSKYPNKYDFKKKDGSNCKNALRSKTSDSNLAEILIKIISKGAAHKRLPTWILHTTDEFMISFISGYFDTDGTITSNKYMSFTSKSKKLIEDVCYILKQKFNIDSSIYKDIKKSYLTEDGKELKTDNESKWREYYVLNICINSSSKKFIQEILNNIVHPEKIQKLENILNKIDDTKIARKSKIIFFPYDLINNLSNKDRSDKFGLTIDLTFRIKKSGYCQKEITIPENLIDESTKLNVITKTLLKKQNNNEIEFIPCDLLDIEYDPSMTTGYDFTVEDYKTFSTADGVFIYDTMAVFALLSKDAQAQVKNKMMSATNNLTINSPNFQLSKEMLIGIFTLTFLENKKLPMKALTSYEDAFKLHIANPVRINYKGANQITTAGRVIFNSFLPSYVPFFNEPINGKKIKEIISKLITINKQDYLETVDRLCKEGFKYATIYPMTISLDMIYIPKKFDKMKEELNKEKDLQKQADIINKMEKELLIYLKEEVPGLYIQMASGAAKGTGQLRQLMVCKGLISDPNGNVLPPVISSFTSGYNSEEYFNASAGSRQGIISRALNTAYGGYAYRKSSYLVAQTQADITNADCGTKRTMSIKLTPEFYSRMSGRYVVNNKGDIVPIDKSMINTKINLRSPIYCKSRKICRICYGDLIFQLQSENVGHVAASQVCSLSEKIMKSSSGLVFYDGKLYSFEDLWKLF